MAERRSRDQQIEDEARGNTEPDAGEPEVTEDEATADAESVEQGDPLTSQGYGEEDFSRRDYIIPGVEADDPDPYKWHTGKKRDHGGLVWRGDIRSQTTPGPQRGDRSRQLVRRDQPCLIVGIQAHRGKRCEPAYTRHTAEHIALLRSESLEALTARTTATAESFFRFR